MSVAIPIAAGQNPMRITMFMNGPNATISESHYVQSVDYNASVANALVLAQKRALLLGSDASMLLVRVSIDGVFRDSQVGDTSLFLPATGTDTCDPRFRSIKLRIESSSLRRKTDYIGLVPDNCIA